MVMHLPLHGWQRPSAPDVLSARKSQASRTHMHRGTATDRLACKAARWWRHALLVPDPVDGMYLTELAGSQCVCVC